MKIITENVYFFQDIIYLLNVTKSLQKSINFLKNSFSDVVSSKAF